MSAAELAAARNEQIGFVFQSFELLPRMSAFKNVEMPLIYAKTSWRTRRQKARRALDRVGLADRIAHRPNQLSGGQKQRVAIARAILNEPAILLADEPTGNLDYQTGRQVMDLLNQLIHQVGRTMLIASHDRDILELADRVLTLREGSLDEPTELLAS